MNEVERTCEVHEVWHVNQTREASFTVAGRYFDHQPGDATHYELISFAAPDGQGARLGSELGYVARDAVFVICGMTGRAYLFSKGDQITEEYIGEHFGLKNAHSLHHFAELTAEAIEGQVIGCQHKVLPW